MASRPAQYPLAADVRLLFQSLCGESRHLKTNISGFGPNSRHEAALFVAMHATETVRPAIVSLRCLALG